MIKPHDLLRVVDFHENTVGAYLDIQNMDVRKASYVKQDLSL